MDFITEWITNIILFVLIATVMDMLLPSSNIQKYTKLVTGLLLIVIILAPILKLLSADFDNILSSFPSTNFSEEKNLENLIELQKKEIQASNRAYILEETAVQLKRGVEEELMEQYGLEITNIYFIVDEKSHSDFPENIQRISVRMRNPSIDAEAVEVVKIVDINTQSPHQTIDDKEHNKLIASLLSETWDIASDIIEIDIEGGDN